MEDIKNLKDTIESMTVQQQIQVGKLLSENKVIMIENKNGVFVNLTDVSEDIIEKINSFINHISKQEDTIKELEIKKQQYKDNFFTNTSHELCNE